MSRHFGPGTGEHGLTRVLDDTQVMAAGDVRDRSHVGREAQQMDGHNGPCARSNLGLHEIGVEIVCLWIDIDKHGSQTVVKHDIHGSDKGDRGHNDLIAVLPAMQLFQGGDGDVQSVGAAVAEDGVLAVMRLGEQRLEFLRPGAIGETVAVKHRRQVFTLFRPQLEFADGDAKWLSLNLLITGHSFPTQLAVFFLQHPFSPSRWKPSLPSHPFDNRDRQGSVQSGQLWDWNRSSRGQSSPGPLPPSSVPEREK